MKVAFATCSAMPDGWVDDHPVAALLGAEYQVWNDESVDWHAYDRVVLRSTWDYSWQVDEFLAWCEEVGPERLRNQPELVAFNADKRYLAEIAAPSVPTTFIAPGDPVPHATNGEIVVKPNFSAGARDTGRFSSLRAALPLIEQIRASGRVALVQPYVPTVDSHGETSLVFFGGELSHALRKRAILRDEGIAPVAEDSELRVAAAMLEPDLVGPGTASAAQQALATAVIAELSARFGTPLYARVDMVDGADGRPRVMELELIEPNLYLGTSPGAAERLAAAVFAS